VVVGPAGRLDGSLAGGPGGLVGAARRKATGIGSPVRCAEGVPHETLAGFLEPDPLDCARVDQAQIVALANGQVSSSGRAAVGWATSSSGACSTGRCRTGSPGRGAGAGQDGGDRPAARKRCVRGVVVQWQGQSIEVEAGVVVAAMASNRA